MSPDQYAATTIAAEAGNQPHEGRVAVGIVILNRVNLPYASDGSVRGAVEHKFAFSEYWSGMTHGHYQQISFSPADAEAIAEKLYAAFVQQQALWADVELAWQEAIQWYAGQPMSFIPGPAFAGLTKKTVLYYNPKIVVTPPPWATVNNQDAVIFDHTFYHDGG